MIKKWATVISWKNGIALVRFAIKTSYSNCTLNVNCSSYLLNRLYSQADYTILVPSKKLLIKGQKVELGIAEESLLYFAIIVYLLPIFGFFLLACVIQILFINDFATMCGGMLGGISGFLLARSFSSKLTKLKAWQPIILRIGISNIHLSECFLHNTH